MRICGRTPMTEPEQQPPSWPSRPLPGTLPGAKGRTGPALTNTINIRQSHNDQSESIVVSHKQCQQGIIWNTQFPYYY